MLISKTGHDVTPFIIIDEETDIMWDYKLREMFKFIRNIPEYNELLSKYVFDIGLPLVIYVTTGDLPFFLEDLLDSDQHQNSNREANLGFCVDGVPIIVLDMLAIHRSHIACEQHMPKHLKYITIEEMVFDVLCHEITHLFQNQSEYVKHNESVYMERECEDFMYTVIFNNIDKSPNPYISKDGYLYSLYKKKLKKYVTDFEYPSNNIITHPLLMQMRVMDDYDIVVSDGGSIIPLFTINKHDRSRVGIEFLLMLLLLGNERANLSDKMINNRYCVVYSLDFSFMVDDIIEVFNFIYKSLGYSANKMMITSLLGHLNDKYDSEVRQILFHGLDIRPFK